MKFLTKIKNLNLSKLLNLKVVGTVFLLMLVIIAYNHWFSLNEELAGSRRHMMAAVDFIKGRCPENIFTYAEGLLRPTDSREEKTTIFNQEMQPLLQNVCMPMEDVQYGFFSVACDNVVALGPYLDRSLLNRLDGAYFHSLYNDDKAQFVKKDRSIFWYGADALIYVEPLREGGELVGFVFVALNQEVIRTAVWGRTLRMLSGFLTMLLFSIMIFQEMFVRMKKELYAFAETVVESGGAQYYSKVPELRPIFRHLSMQTHKMARLARLNMVGEIAVGMAHEIRNPMTTVQGYLQYFLRKKDLEPYRENFEMMLKDIEAANRIITEFVHLSQTALLEFERSDLNAFVREVCDKAAENLPPDWRLRLDLQPVTPFAMSKDSICRMVSNLLDNALEAMPDGGTLTVRTKMAKEAILLQVEDEGCGMSDKVQEKLGTPFFTTKDQHVGLGMAFCYRAVQRHAAELEVESAPGKGSLFTVSFKAQMENDAERSNAK